MHTIFHWIFFNQQIQIFSNSNISVHLMHMTFHWIFTIFCIQPILIYIYICILQIQMIYTSNITFPLNFHNFFTFNEIKFLNKSRIFVHLMYIIFNWIFTIWYVLQFSIEFSRFCTFNEFKFLNKSERSVHFRYIIFHRIFIVYYIKIPYFSTNLDNLYICKQFSISFSWLWHSTNSNFSTNLNNLYI